MRKPDLFLRHRFLFLFILFLLVSSLWSADIDEEKYFRKFFNHVIEVYLKPNGKEFGLLKPREIPIFFGYALGQQAPYVQGIQERKEIFDKLHDLLMIALDNTADNLYRMRLEDSSSPGPPPEVLKKEFRELAVAALGGYVDEQIESAISVPRVVPSIFEGPAFSLRNFRISDIAGEYTLTPLGFQGTVYKTKLLPESGHVGYKMEGVASGWSYSVTKIFFKDSRDRVMMEFSWYGDGVFRGYFVFQNTPDKERMYEMRRTDGFKFEAPEENEGEIDDLFKTPSSPTARLDESVVRSSFDEIKKAVRSFDSDFVRSRVTGAAKDVFESKLTEVFSGGNISLSAKAKVIKTLIPKTSVSIRSVCIDSRNLTATIKVSLSPSLFLSVQDNTVNMRLEDGQWRIFDFRLNPKLKDVIDLLSR